MHASDIKQAGFTIVELLVVIVVIGILATISIVAFNGVQQRAATATLQSDLRNGATQLETVKLDGSEQYPSNANDLKKTEGTTFGYNSDGSSYCLSATSSRAGVPGYHVSSADPSVKQGVCPGHAEPGGAVANQPTDCPTGFIPVPGNATYGTQGGFCAMKYIASNASGVPASVASGTPWVSITQPAAVSAAATTCSGCHLMTEPEWLTIAQNVLNVPSNWSGGSIGSGFIYSGHNDNSPANVIVASSDDTQGYTGTGNSSPSNQRRTLTLSNGEVIWDMAGNVWEWTDASIAANQQPGTGSETNFTNSWKQWNTITSFAGLSTMNQLSNIHSSAPSWTTAEGIGQLNSNPNNANLMGYSRGGRWSSAANAGILSLVLSNAMTNSGNAGYWDVGFRVTR